MFDENKPFIHRDDQARKQKLSDLVRERRSKFSHIDPTTGEIKSIWLVLLLALGNLVGIPVLFSLGLTVYNLYLYNNITPQELLPIVFIGISLFIFVDPILGFIYDRIQNRYKGLVQIILLVLGAVGLLVSQAFLVSGMTTGNNPSLTFNFALGGALFSYSLINTIAVKKSFLFTPSQKSRKRVLYFEGAIGAIALFFIAGLPFVLKNTSTECDCETTCVIMIVDECKTCLQACQNFSDSMLFQTISLICTGVFIIFNFLAVWLISPRNDHNELPRLYSFNKRLFDFLKNPLLTSTAFIYLVESVILFTLVIWIGFYGFRQFDAAGICVNSGSIGLLCTANDYMVLFILVVVLTAIVVSLLSTIDRKNILWHLSTILSFAAGICIVHATAETRHVLYMVIAAAALSYSVLPTSKAYFSDAAYYDEYRTGYVLIHYLTFIFNLATKLAFLFASGYIVTHADSQIYRFGVQETENVNEATGALVILATFILAILKIRLSRFNLTMFDKIQVAIQKNRSEAVVDETITFSDPITNLPVRRPYIIKPHEDARSMLYLDNFARTSEFEKAIRERYDSIKRDANLILSGSFFLVVVCAVIIGVLHNVFIESVGWLLMLPLLALTFGLYAMIYFSNVRTTASILMTEAKIDRDYLNKYFFYRKQQEPPL